MFISRKTLNDILSRLYLLEERAGETEDRFDNNWVENDKKHKRILEEALKRIEVLGAETERKLQLQKETLRTAREDIIRLEEQQKKDRAEIDKANEHATKAAARAILAEKKVAGNTDRDFEPIVPPDLLRPITAEELDESRAEYKKRVLEAGERAAAEFFRELHPAPKPEPKSARPLIDAAERKERWVRAWRGIRGRIELEGPAANDGPRTFTLKGQAGLLRLLGETAPRTRAFFESCPEPNRQYYASSMIEWALRHQVIRADQPRGKHKARRYNRADVVEVFTRAEAFIQEHPEVFGEFTTEGKSTC